MSYIVHSSYPSLHEVPSYFPTTSAARHYYQQPYHYPSHGMIFDEPHIAYYHRPQYHDVVVPRSVAHAMAIEQQLLREEEHRRAMMIAAARHQQRQREHQIAMALLRERELEIQRQRDQERYILHQQQQAALAKKALAMQRLAQEQSQMANTMTAILDNFFGTSVEDSKDKKEKQEDKKVEVENKVSLSNTSTENSQKQPSKKKMHIYLRTFDPVHGWRMQRLLSPSQQSAPDSVKEKETVEVPASRSESPVDSHQEQPTVIPEPTSTAQAPSEAPAPSPNTVATSTIVPEIKQKMHICLRTFDPVNGWRVQKFYYPEATSTKSESVKNEAPSTIESTAAQCPQTSVTEPSIVAQATSPVVDTASKAPAENVAKPKGVSNQPKQKMRLYVRTFCPLSGWKMQKLVHAKNSTNKGKKGATASKKPKSPPSGGPHDHALEVTGSAAAQANITVPPGSEMSPIQPEEKMHIYLRTYDPVNGWRSQELVYPEPSVEQTSDKAATPQGTHADSNAVETSPSLTPSHGNTLETSTELHPEPDQVVAQDCENVSVSSNHGSDEATVEDVDDLEESEDEEN